MTDLTRITTAFGLLDKETQEALRAYDGHVEYYVGPNIWKASKSFVPYLVYRAKPQNLTKPSINWDHITRDCVAIARDENGRGFGYVRIPTQSESAFSVWETDGDVIELCHFTSYVAGDCDWKDSLILRPGAW